MRQSVPRHAVQPRYVALYTSATVKGWEALCFRVVRPCVRLSRESLLALCLINRLVEFRQIYNFGELGAKTNLLHFKITKSEIKVMTRSNLLGNPSESILSP